jgi:uncharacterized protein YgbK (DUF1537 family)
LAALEATGERRAIVAPALPAEGRTTRDGRQFIRGVPVEASAFGGPGTESNLLAMFANDRGLPVEHLDLATIRGSSGAILRYLSNGSGILVADAETEDDLRVLAQAVVSSDVRVLCGSAGFARQLAPLLPMSPSAAVPVAPRRASKPILVVAGSRHEATARQIAVLGRSGAPVVRLDQVHINDACSSVAEIVVAVTAHLAAGRTTVVTTAGLAPSAAGERIVAARLAEVASAPAVQSRLGGLVLTGGDVAMSVCEALDASALWLGGEIYAGQPWGLLAGGALPGLPVATKAGSFGGEGALIACVEYFATIHKAT